VPDLVALHLPPGPSFVDELRRAWDAGDAVLPIDTRLPRAAVDRLLGALRPARVVDRSGACSVAGSRPVEAGDAVVVATSGTTGESKGVVLTHDALAASSAATSARLAIDPARHHWLCCLPVAHVGGLGVITRALWAGTRLTVLPSFSLDAVLAATSRQRPDGGLGNSPATHVSLVVTALAQLGEAAERFERIVLGGSAMPPSLPPNVVTTYGLTETGSGCVYDRVPLDGVEVREVDGELQLRGPMLLRCYRRADDDVDPLLPGGWFPTGDLGSWDPVEGRVAVFGRRGDLIVTGGQKVWPEPVERVLTRLPGIAAVAVVGRADPHWGQAVTAVVVPADPCSPPVLGALREAVKAELAAYCAPQRLELVESLPRTALGKVRRQRL
jgi:O-succinylbenzoic acid--CoA ligase